MHCFQVFVLSYRAGDPDIVINIKLLLRLTSVVDWLILVYGFEKLLAHRMPDILRFEHYIIILCCKRLFSLVAFHSCWFLAPLEGPMGQQPGDQHDVVRSQACCIANCAVMRLLVDSKCVLPVRAYGV